MPNRILKESICVSDTINQLTPLQETFFYRLIVNCDDYGRMDARLAILKSKLFPLRERMTLKDIGDALQALAGAGCVNLYEVGGKPYLCLPSWKVHQTIRNKKSKYPAPEDGEPAFADNCLQLISIASKCPRNPIQSESNPNPESESKSPPTPPGGWGVDPGPLLNALKDFEAMRVKIRKPMTPRARKLLLGHLRKLSGDEGEQIAILEQSILHGWQDVYALKGGARDGGHQEPVAPNLKLGTHL